MPNDKTYIYSVKDSMGDTLIVEAYVSHTGPVVIFDGSRSNPWLTRSNPWLTPKDSKRLRKALKAWERSVA